VRARAKCRFREPQFKVSIENSEILGLAAIIWSHAGISVSSARIAGIHSETETSQTTLTILAIATTDIEWHADHLACFYSLNSFTDFDHFTEVLVSQDFSFLNIGPPLIHVQIGATDVGRRYFHQHVGGFFDLGIWNSSTRARRATRDTPMLS
jgi:hypothetical protein